MKHFYIVSQPTLATIFSAAIWAMIQAKMFIESRVFLCTKANSVLNKNFHDPTEIIILPTQTMHYYMGNPSNLPYICIV